MPTTRPTMRTRALALISTNSIHNLPARHRVAHHRKARIPIILPPHLLPAHPIQPLHSHVFPSTKQLKSSTMSLNAVRATFSSTFESTTSAQSPQIHDSVSRLKAFYSPHPLSLSFPLVARPQGKGIYNCAHSLPHRHPMSFEGVLVCTSSIKALCSILLSLDTMCIAPLVSSPSLRSRVLRKR